MKEKKDGFSTLQSNRLPKCTTIRNPNEYCWSSFVSKNVFEKLEIHDNIQNCNKKRYFMHFQIPVVRVAIRC